MYLTGLVAFLVAASFVGAEFTTGSLANWLTFVPRRSTVFVSKLTVVAAFSLLLGLLAAALTVAPRCSSPRRTISRSRGWARSFRWPRRSVICR